MKKAKQISSKFLSNFPEIRKYKFRSIKFKFPTRGTANDFLHNGSFHEAVGFILAFAQFFGLMPVCGVKSPTAKYLKFKIFSIRFFVSIFFIIAIGWNLAMQFHWLVSSKFEFGKVISIFFDVTNWISIVCFLELATKWPKLMKIWHKVEEFLPQYTNELQNRKLAYQIRSIGFTILACSMCEHLLSIIVGTYGANNCPAIRDPIEAFYRASYPHIFLIYEYNGYLGGFLKFLNTANTFVWSYTDLFVMIVSVGLASKFRRINEDLMEIKGRMVDKNFWSEYRMYYREVANLVSIVDDAMAKTILISISNNLFFICVQLLRSLDKKPTFAHTFYFWVSLVYLIGRTLAVSLFSASINDESKRPLEVFRAVSRPGWCDEVKRFNEEVGNDTIALSGMKFFNLTRQLVLSVTGTIVTYELVLIQFRQDDLISDYDPCLSRNETARSLMFGG